MERSSLSDPLEPHGATRRAFIRGIAAAGASTAAAVALDRSGVLDLSTRTAAAQTPNAFSDFRAVAPSSEDVLRVPDGFRADVVIGYGDPFANGNETLRYGYNNDFLAFFPLPAGSANAGEGLLFVNHEYPSPRFIHGQTDPTRKTLQQIDLERDAVGNSIVHVRREADGRWRVVSPSPFNRRITARGPALQFTGPLAANPGYPGVGTEAVGSLANCSGGITPWGTALSCEENYQDYPETGPGGFGWIPGTVGTSDYVNGDGRTGPAKYGWVCEHDPYRDRLVDSHAGRKHTALGRFRHENAAFRAGSGRRFVLYMGDDRNGGGVYKFVSTRAHVPGDRAANLQILTEGTLHVARWEPTGRRTFDAGGTLVSARAGVGTWREVAESELVDTHRLIRAAVGAAEWDAHFATNRPEDLEVDEDGTVYIALTNDAEVNDVHGAVRRLRESGNDPTAVGPDSPFIWEDYAAGGPTGSRETGREGFSSPDNLVFDKGGNLWVVTDIASSALNDPSRPQAFHRNNAVFMIPGTGQNAGVAFRFANMPVQAEGTGPYFTPDETTLFLNVQHPGEESTTSGDGSPGSFDGVTSYWPRGNKTAGVGTAQPLPSTVAISRVPQAGSPGSAPVVPAPAVPVAAPVARRPGAARRRRDRTRPGIAVVAERRQSLRLLFGRGVPIVFRMNEPGRLTVTLVGRLTTRRRGRRVRGKLRRLAHGTVRVRRAGEVTVRLRPRAALRLLLRRERNVPAVLTVTAVDRAGNRTTRKRALLFR
jgi:secreted PhoX family phosphatase